MQLNLIKNNNSIQEHKISKKVKKDPQEDN